MGDEVLKRNENATTRFEEKKTARQARDGREKRSRKKIDGQHRPLFARRLDVHKTTQIWEVTSTQEKRGGRRHSCFFSVALDA